MPIMNLRVATLFAAALFSVVSSSAQSAPVSNPLDVPPGHQPYEFGPVFEGGNGLTDNRGDFHFLWAGVQGGRVLTNNFGRGILRGNFEYAAQILPYFEAFTPKFQRISCFASPGTAIVECSQPYSVGGTYHGVSITPIILRWNFAHHGRLTPFAEAAGGLIWTNHKFPAYGSTVANLQVNGPNGDTSVWNFTPQGGIGFHYFTNARHSIDFKASGTHISSASLGDRNPGVNASVQFTVGYSWWK